MPVDPIPLRFAPGVYTNNAPRDAVNRYKDSNNVRWVNGLPEKMRGYARIALTGYNGGVYRGMARALHDWVSHDTQQWLAIGSHNKLHLVSNGQLHDITPRRRNSNRTDPFTTTINQPTVTVSDPDHRAEPGDFVYIDSAAAVGGLTLAGDYEIQSVVDVDSYTINAGANATASVTGGGASTLAYDIYAGLASNGDGLGFGVGTFGSGTFGTPRAVGSGLLRRLRIWSLWNWGEDLLGAPSDGRLYWWDRTNGPGGRARLVENSPYNIQRILIDAKAQIVIAIGCSNVDGAANPMRLRWCSSGDFNDWVPTAANSAGGYQFNMGSRLVTGLNTSDTILVWSDTFLWLLPYIGPPYQYVPRDGGSTNIVGPNAAVDVAGVAYWMTFSGFERFTGSIEKMDCDVQTYVFGPESPNRLNPSQADKVVATYYAKHDEVRWDYPSVSGNGENDRYVIFNRRHQCWYYGSITRTCYHGESLFMSGYMDVPYGAYNGYLYKHETGLDIVDGATSVLPWKLVSYDINFNTQRTMLINKFWQNYDENEKAGLFVLNMYRKVKPNQQAYDVKGPYTVDTTKSDVDARARGMQIAIELTNGAALGQWFRLGVWYVFASVMGKR